MSRNDSRGFGRLGRWAAALSLSLVAVACGGHDSNRPITPDTEYPNKTVPMPPVEGQPGEADANDIEPGVGQPKSNGQQGKDDDK